MKNNRILWKKIEEYKYEFEERLKEITRELRHIYNSLESIADSLRRKK